ncbi:MAG: PDZ domain-containing protein, partial [Dehalococcoidia bacterium]|nr:PDZ domain-containing protein [Dehalococcoidia bacterium]
QRQESGITLGAYIGKVRPGSVAEKVGLVQGDIIVEINMRRIANPTSAALLAKKILRFSLLSV